MGIRGVRGKPDPDWEYSETFSSLLGALKT